MSAAKHTPGPWEIGHIESAGLHGVFRAETGDPIAYGALRDPRYRGEDRWPEVDANMALIKAAPDLLAAAEAGRDYILALHAAWQQGGGGRLPREQGGGALVQSTKDDLDAALDRWYFANEAALAKARGAP